MLKRNAAVVLVAATVLGAGAFAWADDGPARPSVAEAQAAGPAEEAPARHHRAWKLARHAYHGDLDVWVKGETREITFDRGRLVAADDDRVTIEYPTGATAEFAITDDTKIRGAGTDGELVTDRPTLVLSEGGETKAVLQRAHDRGNPPADVPAA